MRCTAIEAILKKQDKSACIISHLNKQVKVKQTAAKKCLKIIISTMKYLVRQRIALSGKNDRSENFVNLLRLRAEDNDNLKSWIAKFDAEKRLQQLYLSHDIQNAFISREISL